MRRRAALALLALACGHEPRTLADCARLPARDREDCRLRLLAPLADDPRALERALAEIDDPGSRDLVLLRLAIEDPARAGRWCRMVSTDGAREKCRQVLGRPHLSSTPRAPRSGEAAPR